MIPHLIGVALALTLVYGPAGAGAVEVPAAGPIDEDQLKSQQSAMRLCGTWEWTVHNHKNHREQKTAVVLLPPGAQAPPNLPQPARMVVMGDVVYLRWEFPGGYQEDSLLLAKDDRRLEGTFKNTAGDWGAITAKLISRCTQP